MPPDSCPGTQSRDHEEVLARARSLDPAIVRRRPVFDNLGASASLGRPSNADCSRRSSDAAVLARSLFARHQRRVYGHCLYSLRSTHDAEDALQQTFVNALQALRAGVTPRLEEAWLLHIARNVCLERHRNMSRRAKLEVVASPDSLADVAASPAPDGDGAYLGAALGRLEPRQREALVMREWRGLSYREMGNVLQLSQSAVEALLFRARRSLGRALEDVQRLRPTFNWAGLLASSRCCLQGAVGKTVAVAACGITIASVPMLGRAVDHRHGQAVAAVLPARSAAAGLARSPGNTLRDRESHVAAASPRPVPGPPRQRAPLDTDAVRRPSDHRRHARPRWRRSRHGRCPRRPH